MENCMRIKISSGRMELFAVLNDSKTAKLIWSNLPIISKSEFWGEEVYFYIKPKTSLEKLFAKTVVEAGDVAYWPDGPCMCLFFGPTPNSRDGKIIPASAVNIFGKLEGDCRTLNKVFEGQDIKIEKA